VTKYDNISVYEVEISRSTAAEISRLMDITPCRLLKSYRSFERASCLLLQDQRVPNCFTMKMNETPVHIYQSTGRNFIVVVNVPTS